MTKEGGPKPTPNPNNPEELEFIYVDDESGSSHLLTKDGRVPTDEELRQYAAKAFERYKKMLEELATKEEEEENNQQQNKK